MSNLTLVGDQYRLDLKAAHQIYRNISGTRLPGVTTVMGALAKEALIEWAARVERERFAYLWAKEGALCGADFSGPYAYTLIRDTAADLGTIVHARVHAWLQGKELSPDGLPPDLYEKSIHGLARFQDEWTRRGMTFVAGELPLVSERDQVGGTLDIVALNAQGLHELWDLKTSKPHPKWPWPEVFGQVSEYASLWDEHHPMQPIASVNAVRLGKEEADDLQFYPLSTKERECGLRLFQGARAAYFAKRDMGRL